MPGDVHYQRPSPRGEDRETFVNLQKTLGLIGEVGPQGRCERAHHEQWNAVNACRFETRGEQRMLARTRARTGALSAGRIGRCGPAIWQPLYTEGKFDQSRR